MGGAPGPGRGPAPFGARFMAPLALGAVLNPINSTMLSTALVPIADDLHVRAADTGWLIAALYFTTAVAQPAMGRLVDLFGPRRIFLGSLLFVAAAGLLGHLMSSLLGLVLVRVLLGLGTSAAYPAAMRIFRIQADRIGAPPPRLAMGVLSMAAISTTAVGPLIGGVLTDSFGWRSIFSVNLPLALLAALLILLWVPRDPPRESAAGGLLQELDLAGIGLFSLFLLSLMSLLMRLRDKLLWPALLGAVLSGAALAVHSLRRRQPFIDVRMLARNRPLLLTYGRAFAASTIVFSVYYGFAQWLQSTAGFSSARAGLVTLPMSVLAAVSSLTAARTKGLRLPFLLSFGSALAGCAGLYWLDAATPLWMVVAVVMCFGLPLGAFSTATQAAVYLQAPREEIGSAAGLQRTAQYLGAIAAASLLALSYGQRATDLGLHRLAAAMGALAALLLVATLFDRTIPQLAPTGGSATPGPSPQPHRSRSHP